MLCVKTGILATPRPAMTPKSATASANALAPISILKPLAIDCVLIPSAETWADAYGLDSADGGAIKPRIVLQAAAQCDHIIMHHAEMFGSTLPVSGSTGIGPHRGQTPRPVWPKIDGPIPTLPPAQRHNRFNRTAGPVKSVGDEIVVEDGTLVENGEWQC